MLRIFTNATYATKKFDMRSEGLHPQRLEVDASFGSKEVNESKPINLRGGLHKINHTRVHIPKSVRKNDSKALQDEMRKHF